MGYRKVQVGEPVRHSAELHNATVDLVTKARQTSGQIKRGGKQTKAEGVPCYNASGAAISRGYIVDLATATGTSTRIEIAKPGDGVGVYGIALELIAIAGVGQVAWVGADFDLVVEDGTTPSVGDMVGAVDGQWTAGSGSDFIVAREADSEGYAKAFFAAAAVVDEKVMVRAEEAFAADDINYTAIYIDSDGATGETVELKRPNGIYIKDNAMGFVVQASDGDLIFLPAIEDKLVMISSNDTTADYLIEKLAAGAAISITETTDGGDEDATVAFDFTNISGYDAGETQVLTHVSGTLTWKTAVAC